MAPPADTDPDMITILHALASCTEFPLNSKLLAKAEGINRADNAVTKFKRVLKNHGYKFEGKRVMKIEEDGSENRAVIETTKKKAKTKVTGTSTPKKRRIEDDSVTGDGSDEDAGEGGQVKGEDGGAEYK